MNMRDPTFPIRYFSSVGKRVGLFVFYSLDCFIWTLRSSSQSEDALERSNLINLFSFDT